MLYLINAYDSMYGGLHGMNDIAIVDCDTLAEVEEIAAQMSRDVIESYECIYGDFEDDVDNEVGDRDNDEWVKLYDERVEQDIDFYICVIEDAHGKSVRELEDEAANDLGEFIDKWCKKDF